jgi:hypothetical protein
MQPVPIGLGEDGDGFQALFVTGANDPDGDLTPVGDKDAVERSHADA